MSGNVGFVVDKVALRQVFFEYFGFPCQFSFHRMLHTHHLSSGAGTIGQLVADVSNGLSLTSPQETKKRKDAENDLQELKMKIWRQKTNNREKERASPYKRPRLLEDHRSRSK
jgi:hypothetical protein